MLFNGSLASHRAPLLGVGFWETCRDVTSVTDIVVIAKMVLQDIQKYSKICVLHRFSPVTHLNARSPASADTDQACLDTTPSAAQGGPGGSALLRVKASGELVRGSNRTRCVNHAVVLAGSEDVTHGPRSLLLSFSRPTSCAKHHSSVPLPLLLACPLRYIPPVLHPTRAYMLTRASSLPPHDH